VIISREKVKSTGNRQFLGSDKIEKREFEIKVKNNKAQKINLIIYDQVPISSRPKDIEVTIKEINGARHHLETGELRWLINLDPGQEFSTRFSYQVKFPKSQEINLE
jgi:hypothetical protein